MIKKLKKINYRWYIYAALFAASIVLAVFVYRISYVRLWEALKNTVSSLGTYSNEYFKTEFKVGPGVTEFTAVDVEKFLPFTVEEMLAKLEALFPALFTWEYFAAYMLFVLEGLTLLTAFLPILVLLVYLLWQMMLSAYLKNTEKQGRSKALNTYLKRVRPIKEKITDFFVDLIDFGVYHNLLAWLGFIWLLNLNVISIGVAFFAFYFYFVATFSAPVLLTNIVNLIADLVIMFAGLPLPLWIVIGYVILDVIRKYIAKKRLRHNEAKNKGFIKGKLSLVNLICGFMRSGKNLTETDIGLSAEMIHRDMQLEGMVDQWHKFPDFPWRNLEKNIEKELYEKRIVDLPSAREYVAEVKETFFGDMCSENLFGYEWESFGSEFDNGMYIEDIFDVIEIYAQYYSMYVVDTSLIVANYAVRSGAIKEDAGHFPTWHDDFFDAPSIRETNEGNMSHILNYDQFRLGKRVNTENDVGIFGYGVALMSEKGKERGNALENQHYKKDDEKANPKNDYFNLFLKVIAHSATVDYKSFVLVIGDEQRPESVGADEREVSTLLHITDREQNLLAMPFFEIEELLYSFLRKNFDPFMIEYRYNRDDGTLLTYLMHHLVHRAFGYYTRIYGKYGYDLVKLGIEKGTMDGEIEVHDYYISNHKTKAKRYPTDCYRNMLAVKSLKAHTGINDLPTYRDVRGDDDEMKQQQSFFVSEFQKHLNG